MSHQCQLDESSISRTERILKLGSDAEQRAVRLGHDSVMSILVEPREVYLRQQNIKKVMSVTGEENRQRVACQKKIVV